MAKVSLLAIRYLHYVLCVGDCDCGYNSHVSLHKTMQTLMSFANINVHTIIQYFSFQLTYADIAVFNVLRVSDSQFPAEYAAADIPLLKAFRERIASRPKIAEYLKSDRVKPFCGNSMM